MPIKLYYIHKYEICLNYGGPEEGGWYYKSGEPVYDWMPPSSYDEESAFELCRNLNKAEQERQKEEEEYEFTSVLAYKSQHFEYDVSEDPEAHSFPEHRPHYE